MYKQMLLLTTGEIFSRTSKEKLDWDIVRGLIKDDIVEISNSTIQQYSYEMLCSENAISLKSPINERATAGYRRWWNNRFDKLEQRQGPIDRTTLENTSIRGNVILERPMKEGENG